ncbi:MAG: type IX secretion system membrane protein PorP/SprF, partial [Sphingobacteriales bacterium]
MKFKNIITTMLSLSACLIFDSASAQVNPMGAQYYLNQYLANPAMAGFEEGLIVTGGFRKQIASMPGLPQDQNLTAEYRMNKVGLGFNFNNEKSGILRQNRVVGTFAYHVPVNTKDAQLHFGVSAGAYTERLSEQDIVGNPNDPAIAQLNRRDAY